MKTLSKKSILFFILIVVCIPRCISIYHSFSKTESVLSNEHFVIVYPFENLSSHQYGGDIVTANFITELRRTFQCKVLDAEFIVIRDSDDNISTNDDTDLTSVSMYTKIKLAMRKKADFIITGKVTEFKYKKGLGEEPVIGLNVQMIDVKTRDVVWHASISITKGFIGFREQSLNKYSQKAVYEMLKILKEDLS